MTRLYQTDFVKQRRGLRMGQELIQLLARASGLPEDYFKFRLQKLLIEQGINPETVSEEQIRESAENLLHEVIRELGN